MSSSDSSDSSFFSSFFSSAAKQANINFLLYQISKLQFWGYNSYSNSHLSTTVLMWGHCTEKQLDKFLHIKLTITALVNCNSKRWMQRQDEPCVIDAMLTCSRGCGSTWASSCRAGNGYTTTCWHTGQLTVTWGDTVGTQSSINRHAARRKDELTITQSWNLILQKMM